MQDSILIALFLGAALLIYVTGAVGCAALFFIWFPKLSRTSAALMAGVPVPSVLAVSLIGIAVMESTSQDAAVVLAALAMIALPGFAISWPCALLTLRALERRVERAGVKAQEIFE